MSSALSAKPEDLTKLSRTELSERLISNLTRSCKLSATIDARFSKEHAEIVRTKRKLHELHMEIENIENNIPSKENIDSLQGFIAAQKAALDAAVNANILPLVAQCKKELDKSRAFCAKLTAESSDTKRIAADRAKMQALKKNLENIKKTKLEPLENEWQSLIAEDSACVAASKERKKLSAEEDRIFSLLCKRRK